MFKCKYCMDCEYTSSKMLHEHIKIQHPVVVVDKQKENILTPRKTNDPEIATRFKCPFCAFSLYHRDYVYSHIEKVHPEVLHFTIADIVKKPEKINDNKSDIECFQCPHCKYLCRWKADLLAHFRNQHPSLKPPDNIPCILPASWIDDQSITLKLKCAICNCLIEGKTNFEIHMKEHMSNQGLNITFHGSLPEPVNIKKQQLGKKLQTFLCALCDSVFKRKDSYLYHMRSHKGGTQKRDDIISIKCVMLRKDPTTAPATNNSDSTCSESTNNCNEENHENDKSKGYSNVDNAFVNSNTENQKSDKIIGYTVSDGRKLNTNEQNAMEENLDIVNVKSLSANDNEIHSLPRLVSGSFTCPVCDDFKTFSKSEAVKHVEDSHSSKISEVEILYVLPHVCIEKFDPEKDELLFGCDSCSFSTSTILDAVKHIKSHRNEPETETSGTVENKKAKTLEPKLFDMVSLPNSEFGTHEDTFYKCWSCDPSYLLKTRKGYRKHMLKYHEDVVGCEAGDVMNQMLEIIDGKRRDCYRCTICYEILKTRDGLIDHFKARYPDKVDDLLAQLNNSRNVTSLQNITDETSCEICGQSYQDNVALRRHLVLHLNKSRIHCVTCGIHFNTKDEVANHSVIAHSISNFMCSICGELYCSNKDFMRHLRQHKPDADMTAKNAKILCQHCGMELKNATTNIKRHQLRYHANHISCECSICKEQLVPGGVRSRACTICNRIFCTNYILTAHQMTEHSGQVVSNRRMQNIAAEWRCGGCDMIFDSHKDLQSHSHDCDKGIEKIELMSQNTQYEEVDIEDKSLRTIELSANSSAELIKENFLVYNSGAELPYGCNLCEKSFKCLKYMYNHVRRTHASDTTRRFRCKVCKMGFVSSSSLKQHCKRHIGLRLHQCEYCKKSYKSAAHLREHMMIHTDTPKYACGYCGNRYLQNGALQAHVIHHDRIRPYKCPFCKKGYTTSGDLKRHMDKYDKSIEKTELKCGFCKKTFENTHYLLKHFQTHTVKDPFKCFVCQKKFSSFRQMYRHKDENKHFTDSEYKEALEDLQTPGRMFRPRTNLNLKTKRVTPNDKESVQSMIGKIPATFDQESAKFIFDNQSSFEIQIPDNVNGSQEEATKSALALFQENVVQSMIDVVESEHELEDKEHIYNYYEEDQCQYVVEINDSQTQSDVPEVATNVPTSDISFGTETTTVNGDTVIVHGENRTDIDELTTLVSQNIQTEESGRTQANGFQIHVRFV